MEKGRGLTVDRRPSKQWSLRQTSTVWLLRLRTVVEMIREGVDRTEIPKRGGCSCSIGCAPSASVVATVVEVKICGGILGTVRDNNFQHFSSLPCCTKYTKVIVAFDVGNIVPHQLS